LAPPRPNHAKGRVTAGGLAHKVRGVFEKKMPGKPKEVRRPARPRRSFSPRAPALICCLGSVPAGQPSLRRAPASSQHGRPTSEKHGVALSAQVLLVVDSTQGQNVVNQARGFSKSVGVTGIVLTKLDGTSKGGVVVSIVDELGLPSRPRAVRRATHAARRALTHARAPRPGIPIKFVGVGEKIEDLLVLPRAAAPRLRAVPGHSGSHPRGPRTGALTCAGALRCLTPRSTWRRSFPSRRSNSPSRSARLRLAHKRRAPSGWSQGNVTQPFVEASSESRMPSGAKHFRVS